MKTGLKFITVGIFFFLAVSSLIYITMVTEGGPIKQENIYMKVYFTSAEGVKIGNKVTLQGVPFGYVSKINLVEINSTGAILKKDEKGAIATKVELTLILNKEIPLYPNYEITVKNESLLSGRVIAINPGFPEEKENQIVGVQKQVDLPINGKTLKDPLETLAELIAENRGDIRQIVSNVKEITQKTNEGKGTLGKLVNSNTLHDNVNSTVGDIQIMVNDLREGLEDTREQAPVTSFIRAALSAF